MTRTSALSLLGIAMLVPLLGGLLTRDTAQSQQSPQPGTILTVAGTGKVGFSGDGGPATQAKLNNPEGLALGAAGNLFIGDAYNDCVRRVSRDGTITTVAGIGGHQGFSGDGGPATQAKLDSPRGLAFDATGQLFISDSFNSRVRKVDSNAIITTVAGSGPAGFTGGGFGGDGGSATQARLNGPGGLAVGPAGDLFIADFGNARVRRVDPSRTITTVAGGGHPADGLGDGGLATDAHLPVPAGVAADRNGNLYIADWVTNRVRRVSPDGKIATIAGGGSPADGVGDGGKATDARLDGPGGVTVDAGGNLFITEGHGERVRKVSPEGIIMTVAGTGQVGYTGDGGLATAARLNAPTAPVLDRAGNLYFAEGNRYTVTARPDGSLVESNTVGNQLVREVIGVGVPQ